MRNYMEEDTLTTINKLILLRNLIDTNSFKSFARKKIALEIDFNQLFCNVKRKYIGRFYDLPQNLKLWIGFKEKIGCCISFYLKNRDSELQKAIKTFDYKYLKENSGIDPGYWFTIKMKHWKNKKFSPTKKIEKIKDEILTMI